jgi:predicted O-methyltransferase YrrM
MSALELKQVDETLKYLHEQAISDQVMRGAAKLIASQKGIPFNHAWDTAYMAIDEEVGRFLYFLAVSAEAKNIVEFGCSFGVSTIYLAAAGKDNGGNVITTDIEENKVVGTRQHLEKAGLAEYVEIRKGDALDTLATIPKPIDLLFLDGAKELYLPLFKMLRPNLNHRAIIFADNADKPEVQPLIDYIVKNEPGLPVCACLKTGSSLPA